MASLLKRGQRARVEEIATGICYVAVRLSEGGVGLAAVQPSIGAGTAERTPIIEGIRGRRASEVLSYLTSGKSLFERALGLATANALIRPDPPERERDAIDLMGLGPADRVAMVGLFSPLLERIRRTGAELSVIERDPGKPGIIDPALAARVLRDCSVAIITATTLLNDTLEDVLNALDRPRHVAVLGPSTPACPEAFYGAGVHHLGGAAVVNEREVLRVVSEGGGTPALRPYLRFWNVPVVPGTFSKFDSRG